MGEFLTYAQLTSFLCHSPISALELPLKILQFWSSPTTSQKGISLLYNHLHDNCAFTVSKSLLKLSTDLTHPISDQQWHKAITINLTTSKCSTYWKRAKKRKLCWYYTPYILAKSKLHSSNQCWRGCGQVGTLPHMLWYCPQTCRFWNSIFRLIATLTGIIVKANIEQAILSVSIDHFPPDLRPMVMQVLFAARLILMRKWKSNIAPNISEVINHNSDTYALQQIMTYKHGSLLKFHKQWSPWFSLRNKPSSHLSSTCK